MRQIHNIERAPIQAWQIDCLTPPRTSAFTKTIHVIDDSSVSAVNKAQLPPNPRVCCGRPSSRYPDDLTPFGIIHHCFSVYVGHESSLCQITTCFVLCAQEMNADSHSILQTHAKDVSSYVIDRACSRSHGERMSDLWEEESCNEDGKNAHLHVWAFPKICDVTTVHGRALSLPLHLQRPHCSGLVVVGQRLEGQLSVCFPPLACETPRILPHRLSPP